VERETIANDYADGEQQSDEDAISGPVSLNHDLLDWHSSERRRVACLRASEGGGNGGAETRERRTRSNDGYTPTPMAPFGDPTGGDCLQDPRSLGY
jgi:hypothetical protein